MTKNSALQLNVQYSHYHTFECSIYIYIYIRIYIYIVCQDITIKHVRGEK